MPGMSLRELGPPRQDSYQHNNLRTPIVILDSASDILCIEFRPVFRWQGYAPNVLWFCQRDAAVQRLLRMNVDNLGKRTFVRQDDANLDPHADAQRNEGGDQCSVKVDNDSIAFTNQRFTSALSNDPN